MPFPTEGTAIMFELEPYVKGRDGMDGMDGMGWGGGCGGMEDRNYKMLYLFIILSSPETIPPPPLLFRKSGRKGDRGREINQPFASCWGPHNRDGVRWGGWQGANPCLSRHGNH